MILENNRTLKLKWIFASLLASLVWLLPISAQAALSPVAVSIFPPLQFPPEDFSITGARLSLLWGDHRDVYGLDVGLLGNVTQQDFIGIGIAGGVNITKGTTKIIGLQAAGIANVNMNKTDAFGLQLALGMNYNNAASTVSGLQAALLGNYAPFTDVYGVQVGIFNRAKEVYGLQIGLINVADSLHGIQIGLLNFHNKGTFIVSPVINIGF